MLSDSKRLIVGVHYEPSGVDPHIGAAELALQMTNGVFDTLVHRNIEGDYLPGLATRFEVSEDECVYTFWLRDDVTFHDGTRFNAEAVMFSLERARNPQNESQLAGSMLGSYSRCEIVDEYCCRIVLETPYALLLDALSQAWLAPVSPAAVTKLGAHFARQPVGTGPFIFDRWEAGHCLVIKRNPDYKWGPSLVENSGPAHIDEVEFRFLSDSDKRTAALTNGEVNSIFYVSPKDCQPLRDAGLYDVQTWPIRGIPVCLMMNINRSPTQELAVRQAISYGLDRDALVKEVFHGEFQRAYGPVSQFTLGYEPSVESYYPFNPEKAMQLLHKAGWILGEDGSRYRDNKKLQLDFYALPVNFYPQFGEIVTRYMAEIGVEVIVHTLDPVPWIRAGMRGEHHLIPQGKYASSSQLLSFVYHSRNSGANGYGWSKRSSAQQPGLDTLLEKAETVLTTETFIPLFQEVQKQVMKEALVAPLHCNTNIVACKKSVSGLKFDAIGAYPLLHDVDIDEGAFQ